MAPRTARPLGGQVLRGVVLVAVLALVGLLVVRSTGTHEADARLDGWSAGGGDDVVTVTGIHGACDEVQPAEAEETAREVRVRVPLQVDGGDCEDIGLTLVVDVRLEAPLGGRDVVDARTGAVLPSLPPPR